MNSLWGGICPGKSLMGSLWAEILKEITNELLLGGIHSGDHGSRVPGPNPLRKSVINHLWTGFIGGNTDESSLGGIHDGNN